MLTEADLAQEQVECLDFIDEGEDSLILADVGSGKTVIGETAALRALDDGRVNRWAVFAPKQVALHVWAQETQEWAHLKDLPVAIGVGSEQDVIDAIESDAPVVVFNYERLPWLLENYPVKRFTKDKKRQRVDTLPFDGLMCDEIDKLKSISTNRFKLVRNRIDHFRMRVNMTATPRPNTLLELWGIAYMTDGGQAFGRSFERWKKGDPAQRIPGHFYPLDFNQYQWAPFPDTEEKIFEALDGLAFRLEARGVPPVEIQKPRYIDLPPQLRALYNELEKELYAEIETVAGTKYVLDPDNKAIGQGKLEQLCAGFSYVKESPEQKHNDIVWHSRGKIDALKTIDRVYRDEQLMIVYHFRAERIAIANEIRGIRFLGESPKRDAETISLWNRGVLERIGLHPASGGHGLNLQLSGAHNIPMLHMPWSGGLFKQVCGRLARRRQTAKQVNVWPIIARNTVDELKLALVAERMEALASFLDGLKSRR